MIRFVTWLINCFHKIFGKLERNFCHKLTKHRIMEKAFSLISNRNFKENVLFSLNFLLSAGNWGEMRRDWVQGSSPSYRGNQDGRKAEEFASKH